VANFIWSIADLLRDYYKRSKYADVILPFTILRRLDCVLAPTRDKVFEKYDQFKDRLEDPSLATSAKINSRNKVKLTFEHLFNDKLQEIIDEHFDFYKKVNDNQAIKDALVAKMFEVIYEKLAEANA